MNKLYQFFLNHIIFSFTCHESDESVFTCWLRLSYKLDVWMLAQDYEWYISISAENKSPGLGAVLLWSVSGAELCVSNYISDCLH